MKLPRILYDQLKVHAITEAPRECCGIIAMEGDEAVVLYQATNVADDPRKSYRLDADDQQQIMREVLAAQWDMAIYHSHPIGSPRPSIRDCRLGIPQSLHVIVGLGEGLAIQAWRLDNRGGAAPETLEII